MFLCPVFTHSGPYFSDNNMGGSRLEAAAGCPSAPLPLAKLWSSLLRDPLSSSSIEDHSIVLLFSRDRSRCLTAGSYRWEHRIQSTVLKS